ncbi:BspA family leucine-rich repeat surface protein [Catenovulum sediminis]|uniref:BspA family leucine-rich repeat surface protein n=1 Tax=Catenovulum sediminis TaxID=1740262 RepID=A0ABV1RD02_9ALTE
MLYPPYFAVVIVNLFFLFTLYCVSHLAFASSLEKLSLEMGIETKTFRPFITRWKISEPDTLITLPTWQDGYSYIVDWGDGTIEHWHDAPIAKGQSVAKHLATHVYQQAGTYQIKIWGDFPQIHFDNAIQNSDASGVDKDKIIAIEQWGDIEWRSMGAAFWGCKNLNVTAIDAPDLSKVSKTNGMFRGAVSFNADIGHWDVSTVKNMANMFNGASAFDQDLSTWNFQSARGFRNFLTGVTLSHENYDALLIGWSKQTNLRKRVKIDAGYSQYSTEGEGARNILIEKFAWQFIDGGKVQR